MSRALLVIDVQNEYFTGALPITYPVGHLDRILAVMDAAEGKIPVVVVQHQTEDGPIFRKGSKAWELHPEVGGGLASCWSRRRCRGASPIRRWRTGSASAGSTR